MITVQSPITRPIVSHLKSNLQPHLSLFLIFELPYIFKRQHAIVDYGSCPSQVCVATWLTTPRRLTQKFKQHRKGLPTAPSRNQRGCCNEPAEELVWTQVWLHFAVTRAPHNRTLTQTLTSFTFSASLHHLTTPIFELTIKNNHFCAILRSFGELFLSDCRAAAVLKLPINTPIVDSLRQFFCIWLLERRESSWPRFFCPSVSPRPRIEDFHVRVRFEGDASERSEVVCEQ